MKKNILAIAIASAVAAPVAMADAPTVYGQFNVAIDSMTDEGQQIVNRNSRVGVKGSEDLGNGMKAVYQLETTVNVPDGGANGSFGGARNTFVGLAGGFGTVLMGRHDTPLRMIQPSDGFADSKYAGNNTGRFNGFNLGNAGGVDLRGLSGENRLDNVIAYVSPSFGGISFAVAGTNTSNTTADNALTNGISASVSYGSKKDGLFVAGAITQVGEDHSVAQNAATAPATTAGAIDMVRATVQFKEAGMTVNGMFNQVTVDGNALGNSITVGGAYKMGAITPRAKVSMVTYDDNLGGESATNMAVGADYALGKKTRVYAEYVTLDENNLAGSEKSGVSLGLFHKF